MPTFRSPRNPNFKLSSSRLPRPIVFDDGVYSTDDPAEVVALRRHVRTGALEEVSIEHSRDRYVSGDIEIDQFEADVETVLEAEGDGSTPAFSGQFHTGGFVFNPNDPDGS